MDDDPVLVGPVELLIQQAEELFVARTRTHRSSSLAGRVGGRTWISIALENCPLSIAGLEAQPNTLLLDLVRFRAHGAGGGLRRADRGGWTDALLRVCCTRPRPSADRSSWDAPSRSNPGR
jgi:hypothetical protein